MTTQHRLGSIQQSMQRRKLAWRHNGSETSGVSHSFDSLSSVPAARHRVHIELQTRAARDTASHGCSPVLTSTGSCPVCSHSMTTPSNAPYLCFPCGHSMCLQCVTALVPDGPVCPGCNAHIVSTAPNVALRQILTSSPTTEVLTDGDSGFATGETLPQSFISEHARCSHQTHCCGRF